MTIQLFSDTLRESLNKQISKLTTDPGDLIKIGQAINIIRSAVRELKVFTNGYQFTDEQEEVNFFKNLKPDLVSQYLFHRKLFALAVFDSFRDKAARLENYQIVLNKLERYTFKNQQYYEYWITGSSYLDAQYFLRGKMTHRIIDADDQFTTGYDVKFAKIMANERFRKYIITLLESSSGNKTAEFGLTWTAQKSALIELLYALHSSNVLNKGDADIKVIAKAFETIFNVSLGNFYRKFQDFKFRKENLTMFLDELKINLVRRIEESEN